jgi:hypothetical protein
LKPYSPSRGGQMQILLTHGQKEKEKEKSRLSFKPMGNKPMNLSFLRSLTKIFLHKNN